MSEDIPDEMSSVGEMVVEMTQFGVGNGRMVLGCSMARRKSRVSIELGVQIKSIRLAPEPIRLHIDFQFNVQNALRIVSSSSESIPKSNDVILRDELTKDEVIISHRTIGSSERCGVFVFHMGQRLTSRLTVAAGGPPANVPATNLGTGSSLEGWRSIREEGRMSSFSKSPSLPLRIVEN
ncbi:hypothetical protein PIB30_025784 [Stylosanthes scabra]|uniref:Uncharacterized protein n=1 Tax=Stylosanthes scabra TaxID=79078 RepID=A0ABU6SA68_9FABA|nr:hypothetical protein [Stylosanthes scabra]